MKNIREIHSEAMRMVKEAEYFLEQRLNEQYIDYLEKALSLEEEAAMELFSKLDSEPTRSVLFRSAANIAYNLGRYDKSEKLIYQALSGSPHLEIRNELLELKEKIDIAIAGEFTSSDVIEYNYVNLLKANSINLKIEPKTERFSKAVMVESVVDFLRNLQTSYKNFAEINFKKEFNTDELEDVESFENTLSLIRKESQLLMVDLQFKSFGVGIVADSEIMNYTSLMSDEYRGFKKNVFEVFKKDVLFAEYNSDDFQNKISDKYNDNERVKIYSPLISSFDQKSSYKVSISDPSFKYKIKDIPVLEKRTIGMLKPKYNIVREEPDLILKKTIELTDVEGTKKSKLQTEFLTYAEFDLQISTINDKSNPIDIYFIEPYDLKLVFSDNHFSIKDDFFDTYSEGKDPKDVEKHYGYLLTTRYLNLITSPEITVTEEDLLQKMQSRFVPSDKH